MQEQELIDHARKKLAGKGYGMFDWVEELLAGIDLLDQRPRHLRRKIAILLQITVDEIPYKTFHSWLDRYRKSKRKGKTHKKAVAGEKAPGNVSWKDFKPTELVAKSTAEEPIFKRVDYNDQ